MEDEVGTRTTEISADYRAQIQREAGEKYALPMGLHNRLQGNTQAEIFADARDLSYMLLSKGNYSVEYVTQHHDAIRALMQEVNQSSARP